MMGIIKYNSNVCLLIISILEATLALLSTLSVLPLDIEWSRSIHGHGQGVGGLTLAT
jgi:hypothetical protein